MKSKLLKATLFATAALAMGAMATATQAKTTTLTYTFGTAYGGEYCDGITLTSSDKVTYSGTHTGSCLDSTNYAGGFASKIKVDSAKTYVNASTTDNLDLPGYAITFLLDVKGSEWYLYTNIGSGFELFNEGVLIKGAPPVGKHGAKKASVFKNPKATDKPFCSGRLDLEFGGGGPGPAAVFRFADETRRSLRPDVRRPLAGAAGPGDADASSRAWTTDGTGANAPRSLFVDRHLVSRLLKSVSCRRSTRLPV
jgi:hypothetical protein